MQPSDIKMVDDFEAGRRPLVRKVAGAEPSTAVALSVCPGVGLSHAADPAGALPSVREAWGPVLEVWEGHAADDEIRLSGSSGGAATALALHCIDHEGMHGVVHIRARRDVPYLNETTLSTSRSELLSATGSRYAPASPCDRLDLVRDAPEPCVFIGKPCDVAATSKARNVDMALDERLGLTIALFCAGTPSTRGTLEMLTTMGIDQPRDVTELRYRGNGWPGMARADVTSNGVSTHRELTYDESWGAVLQRHRQWRCYVCADHTGEFADIAVGDPWHRSTDGDPGRSLIVVRTDRGKRILDSAMASGAIVAQRVDPDRIPASQPGLLKVRGAAWGRILACRMLGIPAPAYQGLPTFPVWAKSLTVKEQLQSIVGLLRRVKRKGLMRSHPVSAWDGGTDQP